MTVPLAVAAASGLVGGVGDLDLPPTGEEEDVRAHFLTLFGGGSDHHRGGVFQGASVGVWVEESSGGDRKSFGVEDGGLEVDELPFWVVGEVSEGEAMDGKLVFVGSGAEGKPGRDANWEGFVEASCEGREEGGVIRGGGRRVNP